MARVTDSVWWGGWESRGRRAQTLVAGQGLTLSLLKYKYTFKFRDQQTKGYAWYYSPGTGEAGESNSMPT